MEKANTRRTFECQICKQKLGHKSSLIRHIKKCEQPPKPSLRQKACNRCAASKTRCDLGKPCCSRCSKRGVLCEYVTSSQETIDCSTSNEASDQIETFRNQRGSAAFETPNPAQTPNNFSHPRPEIAAGHPAYSPLDQIFYPHPDPLNGNEYTQGATFPDVNHDGSGVFPSPACSASDTPDECLLKSLDSLNGMHNGMEIYAQQGINPMTALTNHSMEFLFRTYRSWPRMMAEGFQLPPLLHHSQMEQKNLPTPLAHCFTLTKMWHGQCEGTSELIRETIQNEMRSLCAKYQSVDEITRLAAIQALVIYTIIMLFPSRSLEPASPQSCALFQRLDKFIYDVMCTGLVLREERNHVRPPSWKAWVHVTCKRRAVVTLYLLYWCFAVYNGIPARSCKILGPIPASAPKFLWQATSAEEWETLYNRWLVKWDDGCFLQCELDHVQPGIVMNRRAEMWLEEVDEFGLLIMSVVNASDRRPEMLKIE